MRFKHVSIQNFRPARFFSSSAKVLNLREFLAGLATLCLGLHVPQTESDEPASIVIREINDLDRTPNLIRLLTESGSQLVGSEPEFMLSGLSDP